MTEESDDIVRAILQKQRLRPRNGFPAYPSEPDLLLFVVWCTTYLLLIPFHAYLAYFPAYFAAYFTSSRPSLISKHLSVLILLIRTYLGLFALNK